MPTATSPSLDVPTRRRLTAARLFAGAAAVLAVGGLLAADSSDGTVDEPVKPATEGGRRGVLPPVIVRDLGLERIETYDGEKLMVPVFECWRPICGGDPSAMGVAGLQASIDVHESLMEEGGLEIDSTQSINGFNVVFTVGGTVPSSALPAIQAVEQYVESLWSDPVTLRISISFQSLAPGVLGSAGSSLLAVPYSTGRSGLVNGRDASDTVLPRLPTGSTVKVRYDGSSAAVTSENRLVFPRANMKSTVADSSGSDASITFSTVFPFDFNPADGVNGFSFRDVLVHEVGHAMGFVSASDFIAGDMTSMDLFRFQTTDGSADYNPDSIAEFTSRPRLVSKNKPDDAHHVEIGTAEYPMSDGDPYQSSHLREQPTSLGLMDPAIGPGVTRHPFYFNSRDLAILDAIGWDR